VSNKTQNLIIGILILGVIPIIALYGVNYEISHELGQLIFAGWILTLMIVSGTYESYKAHRKSDKDLEDLIKRVDQDKNTN
jgi:hypothetical protein